MKHLGQATDPDALQAMMKDGTLPSEPTDEEGMPISEEEREEMRRQLQSVARMPTASWLRAS